MAKKYYVFKIIFQQRDQIYEIYAKQVMESDMYGFIVVEELVFGEHTTVLVDPAEERLKNEFVDVKRTYIPIHALIRIDELEREGELKLTPKATSANTNISPFPGSTRLQPKEDK